MLRLGNLVSRDKFFGIVLNRYASLAHPCRQLFIPSSKIKRQQKLSDGKGNLKNKRKAAGEKSRLRSKQGNVPTSAPADLSSLRSLSQELSSYIRYNSNPDTDTAEFDHDLAFNQIYEEISSIQTPQQPQLQALPHDIKLELPEEIRDRLGLIIDFSSFDGRADSYDWNMVLSQLSQSGGFTNLNVTSINNFIKLIPSKQLVDLIPVIEQMFREADLEVPYKTEWRFFKALCVGSKLPDSQIERLEYYFNKFLQEKGDKIDFFETMTFAYVKNYNMRKVEALLKEMQSKEMVISNQIFKAILRGYIHYEKNFQKALETFDGMKFLSEKTQPDSRDYEEIIKACVSEGQLEKGMDFYQEALDKKLGVEQGVFVALARGCSISKKYSSKSWEFLFKIYDHGWKPDLATYEAMLFIFAQEGEVNLTRALFYKMLQTGSVTPKALSYLMKSYSRYNSAVTGTKSKLNTGGERDRFFRRNILESVDFQQGTVDEFPFLPLKNLSSKELVFAEAQAVWKYISTHKPDFASPYFVSSFLSTALNHASSLNEFSNKFEECTYLDTTGLRTRQVVDDSSSSSSSSIEEGPFEKGNQEVSSPAHISALSDTTQQQQQQPHNFVKIPRNTASYLIALRAAVKHKDYEFAKSILEERGTYRKTSQFQELPAEERKKLDFQFACAMVDCFTKLGILHDALAIALSSEGTFNWTMKELRKLMKATLVLGDRKTEDAIKGIVARTRARTGSGIMKDDYLKAQAKLNRGVVYAH
ncbi:CCM1 [Candida oxycetoniae]|uniref:CCM1 n=1 Tax=Candida oxycetoniae TaxID=497107 RepID=A0AAI9SUT7_9ASCO|nr:CCM1 [Candida oxycetoniae]KAI3403103.2 CCM1 [Candida oxycetoniae]